jgi:formylglycine-generating enzyme required for sulfatase activity
LKRFIVSIVFIALAILLPAVDVMSPRPSSGDFDETPANEVRITHSFRISETEITSAQFRRFRPESRVRSLRERRQLVRRNGVLQTAQPA